MKKLLKVFGCLCVCAPALCCGGFSDPYDDIYMHIYRLFMLHKTSEAVELCLHTIEDENLPKTDLIHFYEILALMGGKDSQNTPQERCAVSHAVTVFLKERGVISSD